MKNNEITMKLYEVSTLVDQDNPAKITHVSGRIADHSDPVKQTQYITFQLSTDAPTNLNGATMRQHVVRLIRDICILEDNQYANLRGLTAILPSNLKD